MHNDPLYDPYKLRKNPDETMAVYANRTQAYYHKRYNDLLKKAGGNPNDLDKLSPDEVYELYASYNFGRCMDYVQQDSKNAAKVEAALRVPGEKDNLRELESEIADCTLTPCDPLFVKSIKELIDKTLTSIEKDQALAADPPDPNYQQLAAAPTDTSVGYKEALRVSMERFQGAQEANDSEWLARQFTAMQLYQKLIAQALRGEADAQQKQADQLPADNPQTLAQLQAAQSAMLDRLCWGEGFSPEAVKELQAAGLSDAEIQALIKDLLAQNGPPVKSLRTTLLDMATEYRTEASDYDWIATRPIASETGNSAGQPLLQTYLVGNPHDEAETVDLFIARSQSLLTGNSLSKTWLRKPRAKLPRQP